MNDITDSVRPDFVTSETREHMYGRIIEKLVKEIDKFRTGTDSMEGSLRVMFQTALLNGYFPNQEENSSFSSKFSQVFDQHWGVENSTNAGSSWSAVLEIFSDQEKYPESSQAAGAALIWGARIADEIKALNNL